MCPGVTACLQQICLFGAKLTLPTCADGISIMRALLTVGIAILVVSPGALADGSTLAGSLWRCTRASDKSQFVITFYPGGGVGGGELQDGQVSPYVFYASGVKG